jgi:glucoside 3-dehydrogenase (cytochrome c) hitch-hiker subunit
MCILSVDQLLFHAKTLRSNTKGTKFIASLRSFAHLRETINTINNYIYQSKKTSMNRRYVLKGMGAIMLYGSFPTILSEFLSSCKTKDKELRAGFFTDDEFHLIEGITDALLPATSTPGALDARVPFFVDLVVKNCLTKDDQQMIKNGLQKMNEKENFSSLSAADKLNAVKKIDEVAFKDDVGSTWFKVLKKLSLIGYFTSQEGMTNALNYVKVPGDYKACIPYKQGEKALAKTFLMYW